MLKKLPVSLTIVFLVLGLLLSTQFQSQQAVISSLANQKPEDLMIMIKNLTDKKYDLLNQKIELRSQLRIFENDTSQKDELVTSMQDEINKLNAISGNLPVSGPGVTITIYKSAGDFSLNAEELNAILNELWHAKAEAISVNNIRITDSIKIGEDYSDNMAVTANGKKLEYPILINAIGDPEKLKSEPNVGGGIIFQLQLPPFNFKIGIDQKENLELPAALTKKIELAKPVLEN